jgi:hypothetical protein
MKLMLCQECYDLVVPRNENGVPAWCRCGRHAVWWFDADKGIIRVHDVEGPTVAGPAKINRSAFLIGISNSFLTWSGNVDAEAVRTMLAAIPENYLFKRVGSLVVRFYPGDTGDSGYAPLPKNTPRAERHVP